jgi:hypothetical protein
MTKCLLYYSRNDSILSMRSQPSAGSTFFDFFAIVWSRTAGFCSDRLPWASAALAVVSFTSARSRPVEGQIDRVGTPPGVPATLHRNHFSTRRGHRERPKPTRMACLALLPLRLGHAAGLAPHAIRVQVACLTGDKSGRYLGTVGLLKTNKAAMTSRGDTPPSTPANSFGLTSRRPAPPACGWFR